MTLAKLIRSFVIVLGAAAVAGLSIVRFIHATSKGEAILGGVIAVFAGFFLFFVVFERILRRTPLFARLNRFYVNNRRIVDYSTILFGLITVGAFLCLYPLESRFFGSLRTVIVFLFFCGIIVLCIQVYKSIQRP